VNWETLLSIMIEDERAAIRKYQIALQRADSTQLKSVLERLMHEEEFHVDFLEQEIRRLRTP
jgi:rubrerythrin